MSKSKTPEFVLSKLKRASGGGLEIDYSTQEMVDSAIYADTISRKSPKIQHPDLDKILDGLRPYLSKVLGFKWLSTIMESTELTKEQNEAFGKISKIIYAGVANQEEKLQINGVSISGQDAKRSIIIMGTLQTESKSKVAVNTPLIQLSGKKYGFEENLKEDIDELILEAEQYLFKNKKAQLDIFDGKPAEEADKPDGGTLRKLKEEGTVSTSKVPTGSKVAAN